MDFTLTIQKIKEMADAINAHAFDGKLDLSSIEVGLCSTTRSLAHVSVRRTKRFLEETTYEATALKVSKNFKWTEAELRNVLAHELIHIYEVQVRKTKAGHGLVFRAMMARLNAMGYAVVVKCKNFQGLESKTSSKKVVYALSADKTKIIFASRAVFENSIKPSLSFQTTFMGHTVGTIDENLIRGKYRLCRKYRGYFPVTAEKLSTLGL